MDAIAQFGMHTRNFNNLFCSLLDSGKRLSDASTTLLSYIGSHGRGFCLGGSCGKTCSLIRLLQLGAQPDAPWYSVKPLQIAVASWDVKGVRTLLQAGADPNDCGHENGIAWEDSDLLWRFSGLYGCSPLFICREFECDVILDAWYGRRQGDHNKIEELLVAYKARSFREGWAVEEEELRPEEWSSEVNTNNEVGSVVEYEESYENDAIKEGDVGVEVGGN